MPVIITEYPKWVVFIGDRKTLPPHTMMEDIKGSDGIVLKDQVKILINSEEDEFALEDEPKKMAIQKDLKEKYDMDIDLRRYKGPTGLGSLEAYYKAVQAESKKSKNK